MNKNEQGFYVKIRDDLYLGPYENLNAARSEARKKGPDLLIYHGVLKRISEGIIDDSQLFLVPKIEK